MIVLITLASVLVAMLIGSILYHWGHEAGKWEERRLILYRLKSRTDGKTNTLALLQERIRFLDDICPPDNEEVKK